MSKILGFDVYGTLVNTAAIETPLRELMGDLAGVFAARWREKQLEYSFRRGLMQHYADFSVCTRQALDYCCEAMAQPLSREQRSALIAAELPISSRVSLDRRFRSFTSILSAEVSSALSAISTRRSALNGFSI